MKKRYIFFDIDGTITDKKTGQVVPSALKAIELLQKEGHFVAIATGRANYKSIDIAKKLGIHHIVSNGGGTLMVNDEIIYNEPLDYEKSLYTIKQAEELGYGVLVSEKNNIEVFMNNEIFIKQMGYRKEPTIYIYDEKRSYEDIKEFLKIYISIPKSEEHKLTYLNDLGHIRFLGDYLYIQHDKKDKGIYKMLELIKGNREDVVVFGDDDNDLIMFKDEWLNVAMGNACDCLKEKADFVTKDNVDDGILYACYKLKLIRE